MWWVRKLLEADEDDRREAQKEVLVVTVISLMPLVLAALVNYILQKGQGAENVDYLLILLSSIAGGQLFFFIASLIGSIVWLSSRDINSGSFPPRSFFVVYCLVSFGVVSVSIGVDPTLTKLQVPLIFWLSVGLYILSLLIYYALLVFNRAMPPLPDAELRQRSGIIIDKLEGK
tara:strand:+ start:3920 stop:4441 length:522 start_codon:yes stop_codon:yes gene_type:complete